MLFFFWRCLQFYDSVLTVLPSVDCLPGKRFGKMKFNFVLVQLFVF